MRASVGGVAAAVLFVLIAAAAAAAIEPAGGTALALSEAGIASRALLHAGHADAELDAAAGASITDVRPLAVVYLILSVTRVMEPPVANGMIPLSEGCLPMLARFATLCLPVLDGTPPQVLLRRGRPPRAANANSTATALSSMFRTTKFRRHLHVNSSTGFRRRRPQATR